MKNKKKKKKTWLLYLSGVLALTILTCTYHITGVFYGYTFLLVLSYSNYSVCFSFSFLFFFTILIMKLDQVCLTTWQYVKKVLPERPCKNVSLDICGQQRPRSACTFAIWSGLSVSANEIIGYYRLWMYEWKAKATMIRCTCTRWPESAHFAHVWRHFLAWHGLYCKQ